MAFVYYYTPCFEGPIPDENGDPSTSVVQQPGVDFGSGAEYTDDMPPGMALLKCDTDTMRCVVKAPYGTYARPGWALKTSGEVLTDYPGLPGVV